MVNMVAGAGLTRQPRQRERERERRHIFFTTKSTSDRWTRVIFSSSPGETRQGAITERGRETHTLVVVVATMPLTLAVTMTEAI